MVDVRDLGLRQLMELSVMKITKAKLARMTELVWDWGNNPPPGYKKREYVKSIAALQHCIQLERLWVADSSFSSTKNLENCHKLRELALPYGQIKDLKGLKDKQQLRSLHLGKNRELRNLSPLRGLAR